MSAKYIIGGLVGSFGIAYLCDNLIADQKIFGGQLIIVKLHYSLLLCQLVKQLPLWDPFQAGTTPKTVAEKEWWEATDKKFQAWPRTAGPPVVMNPISRQNFIVKSSDA
ncbi:hypothetical protein HPP92_025527 [Vanilla planifolia]|uniref:Uncharacterized protein n=1 Tax=Vanilla planifolia TaxID=51239 RepID=A0A835PHQ0_VANPL|nr:hypothetical protein HPP92_025527 [Vanilla planifolia]